MRESKCLFPLAACAFKIRVRRLLLCAAMTWKQQLWGGAKVLRTQGSTQCEVAIFLFPTERNCYISRMFKNYNNRYLSTLVNNKVTALV